MGKMRDLFQVIFKLYMGGVLGFPFGLVGFCVGWVLCLAFLVDYSRFRVKDSGGMVR